MKITTVFILLLLSFFSISVNSCKNAPEVTGHGGEPTIKVIVAQAEKKDLSSTRVVTAPVIAYKRVYITARTAGQIIELPYEEGDLVRKGALLARLDIRSQLAQLGNAKSALEEAKRNYNRSRQLYENEAISPAEYEQASRLLEQAEGEVEFWEAEVAFGEIRSPINAVVAAKLVELGNSVAMNDRLYTIEDHSLLVTRPGVSEMDVVHLSKGQNVDLTFDVFGDELFSGKIRRIFPSADQIMRLFTVEVEINQKKTDRIIRPGYLARVNFTTDQRADALVIPSESLTYRDNEPVIFVVHDNDIVELRVIERGVERDGWVEVLSGIDPEEKVVAGNLDALSDKKKVQVTGKFRRYNFRD